MKRLYLFLTLLFCLTGSTEIISQTQMSSSTMAGITSIRKSLNLNRGIPPQEVVDFYPIHRHEGRYYVSTIAKTDAEFSKSDYRRNGFKVGATIKDIVTIQIPIEELFIKDYPGLAYLEFAEKIEPELDQSIIDTRVQLVHEGLGLPSAYTGKGVLLGIADWGFDYTHPTFYDTTLTTNRIRAAWDQEKIIGTPPEGFDHGAVYLTPEELVDAKSDTFSEITDYHGTHVAGIAGGSGGGTKYRGAGIESELIFSQMRYETASALDAFQWMHSIAQQDGKRLVINNSWGTQRTNPLDGTSLVSQAIDALSEEGVVFVFSAGNNGGINFHLKKSFDNDSVKTRIMGFEYNTDNKLWGQTVSAWGEPGKQFSVQYRVLDNTNQLLGQSELFFTGNGPFFKDTILVVGSDTIFYTLNADAVHPLNGRPQFTLNVKCENQTLRNILYAEAAEGTVHFWNTRLTVYGGGNWGKGFTAPTAGYVNGDKTYGIGHPGVTNSVITCAAHITNFGLTSFTSTGPRMDNVLKPDISAPGDQICSALNYYTVENFTPAATTEFNGKTYEFVRLSGTSMSAPIVAGIVALMLEADPQLTPSEIKSILTNNARHDNHTGSISNEGHVRWGYGKADALNALTAMTNTSVVPFQPSPYSIYPNPVYDILYISGPVTGNQQFSIYTLDGKEMKSGKVEDRINVLDLPAGTYFLVMNQTYTHKLIVTE